MHIRMAISLDQDNIHSVHWSAFAEGEREIISKLAVNLLSEETTPQTISLVAETEGAVVGHVAFSPVTIGTDENYQGYILALLGVKPDYQKQRIGSQLIKSGMQRLSTMGVDILFVYGDPKYYGRFGFLCNCYFINYEKCQYSENMSKIVMKYLFIRFLKEKHRVGYLRKEIYRAFDYNS